MRLHKISRQVFSSLDLRAVHFFFLISSVIIQVFFFFLKDEVGNVFWEKIKRLHHLEKKNVFDRV